MEKGRRGKIQTSWGRVIILSAVIGSLFGGGLWLWQSWTGLTAENQVVSGSANVRATTENTKPIILNNDLPNTDRSLEPLGDKLAEALFQLREQQNELAHQALVEASEMTVKADDNLELQQNLVNGIKQAQDNIANAKNEEAEQHINSLLNQLNMPDN